VNNIKFKQFEWLATEKRVWMAQSVLYISTQFFFFFFLMNAKKKKKLVLLNLICYNKKIKYQKTTESTQK
jgi:hypothetical protein